MMNLHDELNYLIEEPIIVKGNGNIVLFGLNNRFNTELPPKLHSKVAPEEYKETIERVNHLLANNVHKNMKWFICGFFMLCCTFGVSLWPSVHFNKHTRYELEKLLSWENSRLYNQLGLKWSLNKQLVGSPTVVEYVLVIENVKKSKIYWPD